MHAMSTPPHPAPRPAPITKFYRVINSTGCNSCPRVLNEGQGGEGLLRQLAEPVETPPEETFDGGGGGGGAEPSSQERPLEGGRAHGASVMMIATDQSDGRSVVLVGRSLV